MLDRILATMERDGLSAEAYAHALYRFLACGDCVYADLFTDLPSDDFGRVYAALRVSERKRVFLNFRRGTKADAAAVTLATGVYTPCWISDYMDKSALSEFLKAEDLRSLRIGDLACGAGRLLLSTYRSLRELYRKNGVAARVFVHEIVEKNLYGFDLDPSAALLAKCALFAEASVDDPTLSFDSLIFNIFSPSSYKMDDNDINDVENIDIYRQILEYGSLYVPRACDVPQTGDSEYARAMRTLFYPYDVILLNPPYMGKKNLSPVLSAFLSKAYPEGKTEMYAAFLLRALSLLKPHGRLSFLSIHSWMFLTSFKKLRIELLTKTTLLSVLHLGAGTFPELQAYNALSAVLTLENSPPTDGHSISFLSLTHVPDPDKKEAALKNAIEKRIPQADFLSYAGAPLLYQLPSDAFRVLRESTRLGDLYPVRQGLATGDNDRFVRFWFEPDPETVAYGCRTLDEARATGKRWFPYNKGGFYRKWYGMNEYVVDFYDGGREILNFRDAKGKLRSRPQNMDYYFHSGITWSLFGFENFGVRRKDAGFIFDVSGSSLFAPEADLPVILAYLASNVAFYFLSATAPTVNFQVGNIRDLPFILPDAADRERLMHLSDENVALARLDWDEREISFDFRMSPLIALSDEKTPLSDIYHRYATLRETRKAQMRRNEEEINRIFIRIFGLMQSVSSTVTDRDLTLKSPVPVTEIEDLISFYVGCKTGRFTANGDTLYRNGVHPVSEDELIAGFPSFLSAHFGFAHLETDLMFVENCLKMPLKHYFKKHFYKKHCARYREHPILFRVREGNTVLYIPVHRTAETARQLSRYPLTEAFKYRLAQTLRSLSADDGYCKNAEKLAEFT